MKKAAIILLLSLLLILVLLFFVPPQNRPQPEGISLDTSHSWFSDFMEIDDMAYSKCRLTVINQTGTKAYVRISAEASLYDRWNLYAQKELTGYTMDMKTDIFPLEGGENELLVYFGAPYGGRYQRFNRSLPWNIQLYTVDSTDPAIDCVSEERAYGSSVLYSREELRAGKNAFSYDFDRDGEDETISIENNEGDHTFQLADGDSMSNRLVIRSQLSPECILLHDFGFPDGSLELIVCWGGQTQGSFQGRRGIESSIAHDHGTSLIRVCAGELTSDMGEIYGSGGYHIEPAASYDAPLFSVSGNRVTLNGWQCPIRIDLQNSLNLG